MGSENYVSLRELFGGKQQHTGATDKEVLPWEEHGGPKQMVCQEASGVFLLPSPSDFEGEVKKDGTATKSAKAENSEHAQADSASLSKPDLKMETKGVEGVCTDKERHEKETEPRAEQCTFDNGIDENTLPLLASLNSDHANTSGGTIAQGKIKHENSIPTQDTKIVKEHEENYYTDEEDSSDDSRNQKVRLKLSKKSASTKAVKKITVSISSSSSSPSCSSDTDCSEAGSDGYLSDSSCSSKKKIACSFARLSPRQKSRPEQKFVEVKPKLGDCAEESEDTVTDVTPLSTPDISPIQSFELAASNDKKLKIKRQDNVSQDLCEPEKDHRCHQKVLHEAMDLNNLLKAFLQLEKKEQLNLVLDPPSTGSRKNYSFTNEEVRQIDQENQRLLKELAKQPRSKSASLKKPSVPAPKMYHSAINRQKEQQRIDRENLAFFKKLEAVKPTVGMKCSDQLRDYQRQMSYLNAAPPAPRRGKSALSHHSPSRGASQASSHSASSSASRKSESPMLDSPRRGLQRLSSANVHAAWL